MTDVFIDPFSRETWGKTYQYHKDRTPYDTFSRVARGVAAAETNRGDYNKWNLEFYNEISCMRLIPAGRILANAGTEWDSVTLINCFVSSSVEKPDSLVGIMEQLTNLAETLKSEGGWGHNFSAIRPRSAFIQGVGVESPGAVKFMEAFDTVSEIVTAGSGKKKRTAKGKKKIRKGAMMFLLDCWHPDIQEFITAKRTGGRLTHANLSVNFTDEFMEKLIAVKNGDASQNQWDLVFPDTTVNGYDEIWEGDLAAWREQGLPVNVYESVRVTDLWDLVMASTYNRAEPGVMFLDRAQALYPSNYMSRVVASNPCSEQIMPPGGCCDLASINLTQFVRVDRKGERFFNAVEFESSVRTGVRFLDNVNDISNAPLPGYVKAMREHRRIGLGLAGWGSFLLMMRIAFGSEEAAEMRDYILGIYSRTAYTESVALAKERGMFTGCDPLKHAEGEFVKSLNLPGKVMDDMRKYGIRNSSVLSFQPNGNTSIFANIISGGVEPVFSFEYNRTVIMEYAPEEIAALTPRWYEGEMHETDLFKWAQEGDEKILRAEVEGTVYKIDSSRGLTKVVPCIDYGVRWLQAHGEWDPDADWAVCAHDLTTDEHLNDLEGFARAVDSSVSKTINVPNDCPFEDFKDIYLKAYKTGVIKGLTTYREGTMGVVLSVKDEKNSTNGEEIILDDVKLPQVCDTKTLTVRAEGKKWYIHILQHPDTDRPFGVMVKTNHTEKTVMAMDVVEKLLHMAVEKGIPVKHIEDVSDKIKSDNNSSKITRVLGLLLRHGVLIKNIVKALNQIDTNVGSFVYHIRKILASYIQDGEQVDEAQCEGCGGSNVVYREGCEICLDCGAGKCG